MTASEPCLFCRISSGELPAELLGSTERALAFRDLSPQAPVHLLVIPKAHYRDVGQLAASDPLALAECVALAQSLAPEPGFRLVFNTGAAVGQSVFHVHGHVLAGREFSWPPG